MSEAYRQNTAANLAHAVIAIFRRTVRHVLGNDAARISKRKLCFLERDLMLGLVLAIFVGIPLEIY